MGDAGDPKGVPMREDESDGSISAQIIRTGFGGDSLVHCSFAMRLLCEAANIDRMYR
jgi:hypothetical protein